MNSRTPQWRSTAGAILIHALGILLVASAAAKFARVGNVVMPLAALGFSGGRLTLIAYLEMLSAALFLFPRTRSIGLLLISAYLGGAIASHVGHGESAFRPAIVLSLFWTGTWLRHPVILWSLFRSAGADA